MRAQLHRHQQIEIDNRQIYSALFPTHYTSWYSSRRVAEDCSGFKVLLDEANDRILGAHLLGPEADELINLFALAMQAGLSATALRRTIFAYPTHASAVSYML